MDAVDTAIVEVLTHLEGDKARTCADLIESVAIEHRGTLLYAIGVLLSNRAQCYTGTVLKAAGNHYGIATQ